MFIEVNEDVFINTEKVTDFHIVIDKTYFWRFYLGDNNAVDSKRFKTKEEAYSWLYQYFKDKINKSENEIFNIYKVFKHIYYKLISLTTSGSKDFCASPYWIIIDPEKLYSDKEVKAEEIARCITGIFFSRNDAEEYLSETYGFSAKSIVYSLNGVEDWEQVWKTIEDIQKEKGIYKTK